MYSIVFYFNVLETEKILQFCQPNILDARGTRGKHAASSVSRRFTHASLAFTTSSEKMYAETGSVYKQFSQRGRTESSWRILRGILLIRLLEFSEIRTNVCHELLPWDPSTVYLLVFNILGKSYEVKFQLSFHTQLSLYSAASWNYVIATDPTNLYI